MAFGDLQERNCKHCPPAHSMDMSSQVTHMSHDEAPSGAPCETDASQCGFLDNYNYDGRTVQIKVKDAQSDVPVAIVPAFVTMPVPDSVPVADGIGDASFRPGDQPPLNVLYCVYLD